MRSADGRSTQPPQRVVTFVENDDRRRRQPAVRRPIFLGHIARGVSGDDSELESLGHRGGQLCDIRDCPRRVVAAVFGNDQEPAPFLQRARPRQCVGVDRGVRKSRLPLCLLRPYRRKEPVERRGVLPDGAIVDLLRTDPGGDRQNHQADANRSHQQSIGPRGPGS